MENKSLKIVYTITERGERSYWNKIGIGYVNRDGSINIKLDAVPVNGTMQLRDWTARDDVPAHDGRSDGRYDGRADNRQESRKGSNGSSRNASSQIIDDIPGGF